MRILGIDPGLKLTGYAVLEGDPGVTGPPRIVEAGTLRFDGRRTVADRLVELERDLKELIERTGPDAAAVEAIFVHGVHPMTGVVMGHARGVVLLSLRRAGLAITELKPTAVKKSVCGNGHARKPQVQAAVAALLGLSEAPEPPDVADAIAIAICALGRFDVED